MKDILVRAMISGTIAAAAVTVVASLASRRATGSFPAAINATTHAFWPEAAPRQNGYSWRYTATGLLTNCGASVFWAIVYEALAPKRRAPSSGEAARRGLLVSAIAYLTDYYVVPRRLTPGFELRLPRFALAPIYAALALGLCLRDMLRRAGR